MGKSSSKQYSDVVSKKNMTIHEFEEEQGKLLPKDQEIRGAWLEYLSQFPHLSQPFTAPLLSTATK